MREGRDLMIGDKVMGRGEERVIMRKYRGMRI